MKLLVLAAGIGSRFGGVKQVAAAGPNGETIVEYNVWNALQEGFDGFVFLIRRDIERDFTEAVLSRLPRGLRVRLAFQEPDMFVPEAAAKAARAAGRRKPWGTGHALLCAEEALGGDRFAVLNADDHYGRAALRVVAECLGSSKEPGRFCMPAYRLADVVGDTGSVSRAICRVDSKGYLEAIREHKKIERQGDLIYSFDSGGAKTLLPPDSAVSMNLWGLDSAVFGRTRELFREFLSDEGNLGSGEFYLPEIVGTMLREGSAKVRAFPVSERYFGLTNPADLEFVRSEVSAMIADGQLPSPLWAGFDADLSGLPEGGEG